MEFSIPDFSLSQSLLWEAFEKRTCRRKVFLPLSLFQADENKYDFFKKYFKKAILGQGY